MWNMYVIMSEIKVIIYEAKTVISEQTVLQIRIKLWSEKMLELTITEYLQDGWTKDEREMHVKSFINVVFGKLDYNGIIII
jgi:hypothetical protein